jgi:hypothetical protein
MITLFENFKNSENMKIGDFPHVIEFFKDKDIENIPIYVITEENWPDGKARQTENDRKGGISIHEDHVENDIPIGWLIHEVGHVLDLRGERKDYLVDKKDLNGYPNVDDEQTPMYYQFQYLINKGLSEDDVIILEEKSYSNKKGGGTLWTQYKDDFFREYYKKIKELIEK